MLGAYSSDIKRYLTKNHEVIMCGIALNDGLDLNVIEAAKFYNVNSINKFIIAKY